jgi:hypothetical protein
VTPIGEREGDSGNGRRGDFSRAERGKDRGVEGKGGREQHWSGRGSRRATLGESVRIGGSLGEVGLAGLWEIRTREQVSVVCFDLRETMGVP